MAADRAAAMLAPPWLPAAVAGHVPEACRAAALGVPLLLAAPSPTRLALARALHASGGCHGPLLVVAGRRPPLADVPPGAAILVDVRSLAPETALVVAALCDDGRVWVLAGCDPNVPVPAPLGDRLGTIVLAVPPLDERTADVPALSQALLAARAARAGRSAPRLAPGTLARLVERAWPGDVPELDGVLAAAFARAGDAAEIAPEHLAPAGSTLPHATSQLELLLAELGHELRNPLVTIKTFAGQLPVLLEDTELRERFATLAGEAVGRIDALVENLLEFARLAAPRRQAIEVGPLLDGVLARVAAELGDKAVAVRRTGDAAARCAGDAAHLSYALRNLFAGILREVSPREELLLDTSTNGTVRVRFRAGGADLARLRRLVAPESDGALGTGTLPLAFTLARAALARSGGTLDVVTEGDGTVMVVGLPAQITDNGR
jgi:signal transduction histidine kinase